MIINEERRVMNLLEMGDFSPLNSYYEVMLIVRYLVNNKGINIKEELIDQTKSILREKMSDYLEWEWEDRIESFAKSELKNKTPLTNISSIYVTQKDIDEVRELKNQYQRKLLFTLIMYARFAYIKKGEDKEWIGAKQEDVFKSANLDKLTLAKQDYVVADLIELGKLSYDYKVDGLGMKLNNVNNQGDIITEITSFENIGNFIENYINVHYNGHKSCIVCGKTYKAKKQSPRKYCTSCAKKSKLESTKRSKSKNKVCEN